MINARERIRRARCALLLEKNWLFFGALALRLELAEDASIPTMATDGRRLLFNPQFVDTLSDPELRGVIAHEVLHCANGHMWRRDGREPGAWNVACDQAINHHVIAAGLPLPTGALPGCDESAEALYRAPAPGGQSGGQSGSQPGNDPGGCGAVLDAPSDPDQPGGPADWQIATIQAAQAAKAAGALPGCAARLLDEILRPPVDWRSILADFVQRTARNDYDWRLPNARHIGRGIILPGLRSNELPDVVIVCDTSGSIDGPVLALFAGAISDVLAAYPVTIHVVSADARVHSVDTYSTADLPIAPPAFMGGGGTDFRPAFTWLRTADVQPACLIYLTDGYGRFPDDPPDCPVLWAMTTDRVPPWGETIRIPD